VRRTAVRFGLLAAACLLAACSKSEPDLKAYAPAFVAPPAKARVVEYSFGVTPMSNFRNIYETFQPIIDHLNGGLGDAKLVLEVPRGLAEHQRQLQSRHFAFALSNPYHTLRAAEHGSYRIFAKMGDDDAFRGIWIVRRDAGIASLAGLKGKKISFPPRSALAATMMTQLQLKEAGIDPRTDIEARYLGSQHASIMEVYSGRVTAGATWPLAWVTFQRVHPAEARKLEARFPTAPLVNQGIVARNDVPPELVSRVAELMAAMHKTERGRSLLAQVPIGTFEAAGDAQYRVVSEFIDKYKLAFDALPE
jgi:phosphonate transport system substrate-binding protein